MSGTSIIATAWGRTDGVFPYSGSQLDADVQHYAAFGSNLLMSQLRKRTGAARVAGLYRIAGWRQTYGERGKATAVEDRGSSLPIAVYEMTAAELCILDCYEGTKYVRTEFRIEGGPTVWTYLLPEQDPKPPTKAYLGLILSGLREHGFLEEAASKEKELNALAS